MREWGDWPRARIREELSWAITSRNLLKAYGRLFNREFVIESAPPSSARRRTCAFLRERQ